ncbi:hypothetical protein ABEB36_015399 [Hypothenemus hampei]|uniref:Uncharacterized protein n=1 Tax=Hypothenemus hampei TaxID=57062 RepID=A0ABD1E104_HYPHA
MPVVKFDEDVPDLLDSEDDSDIDAGPAYHHYCRKSPQTLKQLHLMSFVNLHYCHCIFAVQVTR